MAGVPLSHYRQHRVTAVFAWCYSCHRGDEVDLELLIDRLGPDYPVTDVGRSLICSRCGAKTIQTQPAWPHAISSEADAG